MHFRNKLINKSYVFICTTTCSILVELEFFEPIGRAFTFKAFRGAHMINLCDNCHESV